MDKSTRIFRSIQKGLYTPKSDISINKMIKFYKSLYHNYRQYKGEETPLCETIPCNVSDLPEDTFLFLEAGQRLGALIALTQTKDEILYQFDKSFDKYKKLIVEILDPYFTPNDTLSQNTQNIPEGFSLIQPRYKSPNRKRAYQQLLKNGTKEVYILKEGDAELLKRQSLGNKLAILCGFTASNSQIVSINNEVLFLAPDVRQIIGQFEPFSYHGYLIDNSLDEVIGLCQKITGDISQLIKTLVFDYLILNKNRTARSHRLTKVDNKLQYLLLIENDVLSSNGGEFGTTMDREHGDYLQDLFVKIKLLGEFETVESFFQTLDINLIIDQCLQDMVPDAAARIEEQYKKLERQINENNK